MRVLAIVRSVYNQYINGGTDPTNGATFYSHATSLSRERTDGNNIEFKDINDLQEWIDLNNTYHKSYNPDFTAGTVVFNQSGWPPLFGYYDDGPAVLVYGNALCIPTSQCGSYRPGAKFPPSQTK